MKTWNHYTIITEYGEILPKIPKKLYDRKLYKEFDRDEITEIYQSKNGSERYILKKITVYVKHNPQIRLEL